MGYKDYLLEKKDTKSKDYLVEKKITSLKDIRSSALESLLDIANVKMSYNKIRAIQFLVRLVDNSKNLNVLIQAVKSSVSGSSDKPNLMQLSTKEADELDDLFFDITGIDTEKIK